MGCGRDPGSTPESQQHEIPLAWLRRQAELRRTRGEARADGGILSDDLRNVGAVAERCDRSSLGGARYICRRANAMK